MRAALLLAAVLCASTGAHAQGNVGDPEITFHGGLFDGLIIGDVVRPDNKRRIRGLKPSLPDSSPIAASDRPAVKGLLLAYGKGTHRYSPYVTKDAVSIWCEHLADCSAPRPFRDFPFAEKCAANVPYATPEGRVRIEWSYKGMLYYLSWLKLRDGKVAEVETYRADVPRLLIRPAGGA